MDDLILLAFVVGMIVGAAITITALMLTMLICPKGKPDSQ